MIHAFLYWRQRAYRTNNWKKKLRRPAKLSKPQGTWKFRLNAFWGSNRPRAGERKQNCLNNQQSQRIFHWKKPKKTSLGERKTIKNWKINQPAQAPSPQEIHIRGSCDRYWKYNTKSGFQSGSQVFLRNFHEAQLGPHFKGQNSLGNLQHHLMVSVWRMGLGEKRKIREAYLNIDFL